MLTRMTEEGWATVRKVFRACRSRRGAKGRNDRRFLEAVHYFCVHNTSAFTTLLRSQHPLARPAGRVRELEFRVEALLALEPGGRVRGLLRRPRGDEPDGPLGSDVRLHRRAGSRLGR